MKTKAITYENTVRGSFLRRINRFTAEVRIGGKQETVHVKNTGRLKELLLPDAAVTLQESRNPDRKTRYDLISVFKTGFGWVNIDSLAPNALMKLELENGSYDLVRPEYTCGNSRFDFYMERNGEKYLREVKGCTLAADPERGTGLFPDAPTARGVKHLKELAEAAEKGWHCSVAFVIMMNGIRRVEPNDATQPEFGRALRQAAATGVEVLYYSCRVEADGAEIAGMIREEAVREQDLQVLPERKSDTVCRQEQTGITGNSRMKEQMPGIEQEKEPE